MRTRARALLVLTTLLLLALTTFAVSGDAAKRVGTPGNDRLVGTAKADVLLGKGGNDVLLGRKGNDRLDGGTGRDRVSGGPGKDTITGGPGNDSLKGNAGNDRISGGPGRDTINGGPGRDVLVGGGGNDRIAARRSGADTVKCGAGRDLALADFSDRVAANCEEVRQRAGPVSPVDGPLRVGLVTDTGGVDDRGFNEFAIRGLERAEAELGVEGRIFVSERERDYLPNLSAAARRGNDLVIGVGFRMTADTITAAAKFPYAGFAGIDHFYGVEGGGCEQFGTCVLSNTLGLLYPSEEAGYVAGVVAAHMTETKVVSTVGGMKIPPVDNWIAGFQQGVIDTDPSVQFLNAYSGDFGNQALCKEIALDQIAQGSDVVFQVAGQCGLGALRAAGEQGVFGIGVDADQSFAGPHILTSALKPIEASVFEVIRQAQSGEFRGGRNFVFSIQHFPDAQLLAPFSSAVPDDVIAAVEEAKAKLISGEIDPTPVVEAVRAP